MPVVDFGPERNELLEQKILDILESSSYSRRTLKKLAQLLSIKPEILKDFIQFTATKVQILPQGTSPDLFVGKKTTTVTTGTTTVTPQSPETMGRSKPIKPATHASTQETASELAQNFVNSPLITTAELSSCDLKSRAKYVRFGWDHYAREDAVIPYIQDLFAEEGWKYSMISPSFVNRLKEQIAIGPPTMDPVHPKIYFRKERIQGFLNEVYSEELPGITAEELPQPNAQVLFRALVDLEGTQYTKRSLTKLDQEYGLLANDVREICNLHPYIFRKSGAYCGFSPDFRYARRLWQETEGKNTIQEAMGTPEVKGEESRPVASLKPVPKPKKSPKEKERAKLKAELDDLYVRLSGIQKRSRDQVVSQDLNNALFHLEKVHCHLDGPQKKAKTQTKSGGTPVRAVSPIGDIVDRAMGRARDTVTNFFRP